MLRTIHGFDHPALRTKSKKVSRVDATIQKLLDDLAETMLSEAGAGLAANQIGVTVRACVVKGDENNIYQLVNPEIVKAEGSQVGYEGCLSKPGWVGEVERYETVVVKALNRRGKPVRIRASGFTARAFQHEIDHLDGVLFTDRLTSLDTLQPVEQLETEDAADEGGAERAGSAGRAAPRGDSSPLKNMAEAVTA